MSKKNRGTASSHPVPDLQAATDFLDAFFGDAPWHLTAIKKQDGQSFMRGGGTFVGKDRVRRAGSFISKHQAEGDDLYFAINPLKEGIELGTTRRPRKSDGKPMPMVKATKDDVALATHLWIDADPQPRERVT